MKPKEKKRSGWYVNSWKPFLICASLSLFLYACGNKKERFDASGTFEAVEVIVSSEASGRILVLDFQEGQLLEAGQQIGLTDSLQLHLRKMQLQAGIRALESRRLDVSKQLAATRQQIETAQNELQRFQNLFEANAANQKQVDDIKAQITLLEKQLAAQQSTMMQTNQGISQEATAQEMQVAQLQDQIEKCIIKSPLAGSVLVKYAEAGELATIGKPLFKMADTRNMIFRAYVASSQLTKLQIGQQVHVFADYGEGETRQYPGIITWISEKSEFTPKTIQARDERDNLVYAIKVAVENDGYLKIGMYGNLKIIQ
jgi:HlyD family secretion protein